MPTNKYVKIDEINKFNDRRLRNLRLRQERINKNKVKTKLKTNDYVVIKAYGDTIGVSRKLKSVYENIPYRILSIKYFNVILENILDGSQVLRAVDDIKKIGIIDNNEENVKNVPKEVFKMLNILTYENIKEIFENKKKKMKILRWIKG